MDQSSSRVLVVDDNPEIREIIEILLNNEGFEVTCAENGTLALQLLQEQTFDLIILDIMMPGENGYQTCLKLRDLTNAPVLFLSALTQDSDKTLGFSSGGDDYLAKPFSYNELIARTKALIRRYHIYRGKDIPAEISSDCYTFHHLNIYEAKEVLSDGHPIVLTDLEFDILLLLTKNRHQTFSAQHVFESIWNEPYYYGANNTVMVHIRNLRRKIEPDAANPTLIKTIWGKGYRCD